MAFFIEVGPERTVTEILALLQDHDYVVVVDDPQKPEGEKQVLMVGLRRGTFAAYLAAPQRVRRLYARRLLRALETARGIGAAPDLVLVSLPAGTRRQNLFGREGFPILQSW